MLACGDFGLFVKPKHWSLWGHKQARGRGVLRANECVPLSDCGPRQFKRYHVRFKLNKARPKKCGGRRVRLFTKINLRFGQRKPSYAHRIRDSRLFCFP